MRPARAMRMLSRLISAGFCAQLAGTAIACAAGTMGVTEIHRQFGDAVIRVSVITEDPDGRTVPEVYSLTGFFIDSQGRFLTKISKGTSVSRAYIEKGGLSYAANLIGVDRRTELGLFQVSQMPANVAAIPLDRRGEPLAPGSAIVALARPLGLKVSPSPGIIAARESAFSKETIFPCTYSRTNILFGPGEHGAPVIDAAGKLVGIAVVNVPNLSASYLVPANALARVADDLIKTGRVNYVTLRLDFTEEPDAKNQELQVKIAKVEAGSPADLAGIRRGDVVRRLGETPVRSIDDARDILFFARPDDRFMTIVVERDGQLLPFFTLPLETAPDASTPPGIPATSQSPDINPTGPS